MDIVFTILAFLVLISIIVGIHEGGHFLIGRLCGIKMLEFSLGFGPKIFQRKLGKDDTLFTLRALPLGGFVKPLDQSALKPEEWDTLPDQEKKRSFKEAARWKKTLMVAGGPFANFVLAFIVYFIAMTMVGTKGYEPIIAEVIPQSVFDKAGVRAGDKIEVINGHQIKVMGDAYSMLVNGMIQGKNMSITTDKQNDIAIDFSNLSLEDMTTDVSTKLGIYFNGNIGDVIINRVMKDGAAEKSGVKSGDQLVSLENIPFTNVQRAISFINKNAEKELNLVVKRNGEEVNLLITPKAELVGENKIGRVGVEFELQNIQDLQTIYYTPKEALWNSGYKLWDSVYTTLISIKKLVVGDLSLKTISGPVAIADYSGKSAKHGLFSYMMMIAAISIAVGVFNLLPIPALDGGHLAQYAVEGVMQKDLHPKILHYSQIAGFGFIMGLFAFSMCNDLLRYIL